jgi:DNA-binding beta-propeller fold protein YncE
MQGYRQPSASTRRRTGWRYAALGLGATLIVVFGFIADDRVGNPSVIAVGNGPMAIAIAPDGEAAYVVDWSDDAVTPVSLAHGDTGGAIALDGDTARWMGPPSVIAIAVAPDGATAYVDDPITGALLPISLASGTTGMPIRIAGGAGQIAITPDGATAYVVTYDSTVVPVHLATGTTGRPIPISHDAASIAIAPDGATAYVTSYIDSLDSDSGVHHYRDGKITPIDLATGTPGTPIPVGGTPAGIAITPDGATAYVTSPDNDTVVPVNLTAGIAGKPIPDPDGPTGAIAITPDGDTAYVTNYGGGSQNGSVTPVNLAAGTVGKPISDGDAAQAIAINPAGTVAYVADFNSDSVTVLRLKH